MTQIIGVITAIGVIFGGFFAMLRYFTKNNKEAQDSLFKFLAEKNGHLERISNGFMEGQKEMTKDIKTTLGKIDETLFTLANKVERSVLLHEQNKK